MPTATALDPLPTGTDVDYQLGGAVDRPDHVGIIARDRTEEPAQGRYNICYVNGFQTQPDAKKFWRAREGLLLHRKGRLVVDGQWGEWLLDVRTKAKRKRLARIVGAVDRGVRRRRLRRGRARQPRLLHPQPPPHRAPAGTGLRPPARATCPPGRPARGPEEPAGFDGTRIGFDFAVSEECARYDECGRYVEHFGDQVVMIEYRDGDFREACRDFGATHAIVRRDLDLTPVVRAGLLLTCC